MAAAPAGDIMATMTLDQLVEQLAKAYGADLRTVVLYGSAAAGQHVAKRSDYNVLVIVDSLDLSSLSRGAAVAGAWSESGNPPPLTLTTSEWRSSADIFPMEYADILGRHKVLHGNPPFDGISVDKEHLRLELEQQAMGKLLQFRQGILAARGEWKRQAELLSASLTTFMVIFRALVRLHGEEPPTEYGALIDRVAALSGLESAPFVRVVRHVRGEERLAEKEVAAVLAGYLAGAQRLKSHIDQL
ncbi:MAG: nucleotidyltransferase domain-containing protein [Anaerolineae bacterium]|nr:nucleotidyltransferase domain-containing protein [Gemmatimonadaceae bacterium]